MSEDNGEKPRPRGRYGEAREGDLVAEVKTALEQYSDTAVEVPYDPRDAGHPGGMLRRHLDDYEGGYWERARAFRDQTRAPFNDTGIEDTKLWGDSALLTFTQAAGNATVSVGTNLKVFRQRPTTFTLTFTLALLSNAWRTENGNATITVFWQIGVGQVKTVLARTVTFVGSTAFVDGSAASVNDTINVPAMSLTARAVLAGANNTNVGQEHSALVTVIASPFVQ